MDLSSLLGGGGGGGGGSSSATSASNVAATYSHNGKSSNTALYVLAGLVALGLLVFLIRR